jgi:hypothetical protein
MKIKHTLMIFAFFMQIAFANPLIYVGESGPGKGKEIVFVASDHEYRAEESLTGLARILAKHHGFKCTVLFGLDENGHIKAGASNIPGLEALKKADLMVIFTRFLDLPDDQMQHIVDYLDRAGPVVGLRTASHGFKIDNKNSKWHKYHFRYAGEDYKGGFGEQILGNTWEGHYGKNHKQGNQTQIIPEKKGHVILTGVGDLAFGYAGSYNGVIREGMNVLTNSQPLLHFYKNSPIDSSKAPVASSWTRHYKGGNGQKARVYHSTQGASEDMLDADYRRMIINGIFWAIGMESTIKADLKIDFVGPYQPLPYMNQGHASNVKPSDLQDYNSPIMPKGPKHVPSNNKAMKARASAITK